MLIFQPINNVPGMDNEIFVTCMKRTTNILESLSDNRFVINN